jgi:HEAT repeat protein
MAWSKAKTAFASGICVVVAFGIAITALETIHHREAYYKGKPLKVWLRSLDDQNPGLANDAAEDAVRHIGKRGLPIIIPLLEMKNPLHHSAVLACQVLGSDAKPAIPALVELLKSGYANGYVGVALEKIGLDAFPAFVELVTNKNDEVRREALSSLGDLAAYSKSDDALKSAAMSVLLDSLKDTSPFVRGITAMWLGLARRDDATVVPALIQTLGDTDFQVRWNVCLALSRYGTGAAAAAPALQARLNDSKPSVRGTAAIALIRIEPTNSAQLDLLMPILVEDINGIGGRDRNFSSTAAEALADWGPRARAAVPAILNAIQKESGYEQKRLIAALKKIDPAAAAQAGWK